MLKLIVAALLVVPALVVVAFVTALDDAPRTRSPANPIDGTSAAAGADGGVVSLHASIELPPEYPRRYVNVDLDVQRSAENRAIIRRIGIGGLDVPGWLAKAAVQWAAGNWPELGDERLELAAVRVLESYPARLELACVWPGSPVEHLRVRSAATGGRKWPVAYGGRVAEWAAARPGPRAPIRELLQALFGEAAARTEAGADPVVENRTAIIVAAAQAFGCTPVEDGQPVRPVRPMLHRRDDLGRHFVGSAALAALLDRKFSDSIGLDKEYSDSKAISGFSFSDLAANLAGAQLGDLATASPGSARRVQEWMEQAASDADIMPSVGDLPDNLPEEVLKRRFGEPGAEAYQRVLEEIEARIAGVPLYRVSK